MTNELIEAMKERVAETLAHLPAPLTDDDGDTAADAVVSAVIAAAEAAGYRMVPVEPTEAMVIAGESAPSRSLR